MVEPADGDSSTRGFVLDLDDRFDPPTDPVLVERVVAATLAFAGRSGVEVALVLTDDREIGELHGRFLGDPTPTDVISFPRDDGGVDLVVSVERAREVAADSGHSHDHEVALYIVHGLLHTCGYDDLQPAPRKRMRAAEREVLTRLGLSVAAVDEGAHDADDDVVTS